MFKSGLLILIGAVLCALPPSRAEAKAHCHCKLGPITAPYKDFGDVATYGTQYGHNTACKNTCNSTAVNWLSTAANKTAACTASNNASLISYSAVGTGSYIAGSATSCAGGSGGGHITFIGNNAFPRAFVVNNTSYGLPGPSTVSVPANVPVQFELNDSLQWHAQKWTYTATLYRGNQVVETISQKSPIGFKGWVQVQFSPQQASYVHGNVWKVVTSYATSGYSPFVMSFTIP